VFELLRWLSRAVFGPFRPAPEKVLTVNLALGALALLAAGLAAAHADWLGTAVVGGAGLTLAAGAPLVYRRPRLLEAVLRAHGFATLALALALAGGTTLVLVQRLHGGNPSFRYAPGGFLVLLTWAAVQLDVARKAALWIGLASEVIALLLLLSTL